MTLRNLQKAMVAQGFAIDVPKEKRVKYHIGEHWLETKGYFLRVKCDTHDSVTILSKNRRKS